MIGVINLLKPPGMTSNNAVVDIRRLLQEKKVGHMGTLDPGAAGVLPICVGKATRLFPYLVEKSKEYLFEIQFGESTDTLDAYGQKTAAMDCDISQAALEALLPGFRGLQWQTPPLYSALKVKGQKLYELARKGKAVALEEKRRLIEISELECLEQTGKNRFLLRMNCSRGTYVRSLCVDLAQALGTCAYMSFLLRSRAGKFALASSWTLDEIRAEVEKGSVAFFENMDSVLDAYPVYVVADALYEKLRNGVALDLPAPHAKSVEESYSIYCRGQLFGLGNWKSGRLKIDCFLYE